MRFVLLLSLLFIILLTIDHGESWRRRRRRRSRRRRWIGKVYRGYKKYKPLIHAGIGVVRYFGKDTSEFANLATLKANDRDAYDAYMQQVRETLADQYPDEDTDEMLASLDEAVDMQPSQLDLLDENTDDSDESANDSSNEMLENQQ